MPRSSTRDKLGFNVDVDNDVGENWRNIQFTPPGSATSLAIGKGFNHGLQLVVSDIEAAHAELAEPRRRDERHRPFRRRRAEARQGRGPYNSFFFFQDPTATTGRSRRSSRDPTVARARPGGQLSLTFAALADPTRRAILARLADGELTVNEIARPYAMSVQAVSKHLKVLERAGPDQARQGGPMASEPAGPGAAERRVANGSQQYREIATDRMDRLELEIKKLQTARKETRAMGDMEIIIEPGRQDIVFKRTFDAPRDVVFRALTDPELDCPTGGVRASYETIVDEMEPRAGGRWRYINRNRGTGEEFGVPRRVPQGDTGPDRPDNRVRGLSGHVGA